MSFRNRATRFRPKPKPPTDSISVISQVEAPTVTFTPRPSVTSRPRVRPTRFTPRARPTPTPRPITPTPRPTTTAIIPTRTTPRVRTRFTPTPRPPRDDFQRTLLPVAFAEEAPREERVITPPTIRAVARPRARTTRFTPVRTRPKDDISMVATPQVRLGGVTPRFETPLSEQQRANQALLDAGVPTFAEQQRREGLSDFDRALASFGGGVTQEVLNIGAIAGVSEFREEAGSLAIELPFAVVGETFTRPSEETTGGLLGGGGFAGLGFDFRETPDFDKGFEKSGEIQQR